MASRHGGLDLKVTAEYIAELAGWNPDAAVTHPELDSCRSLPARLGADFYCHEPPFGELDGIVDQIHQDLAQTPGVTRQLLRRLRIHPEYELEALGMRHLRQEVETRLDFFARRKDRAIEIGWASLPARDLEKVIQ
jgi:hypothetical protein